MPNSGGRAVRAPPRDSVSAVIVEGFHLSGDIAKSDVLFENGFEMFTCFIAFAHFLQDGSEKIVQFLGFIIESDFFFEGILKAASGEVVESAGGEALAEKAHALQAAVGVVLRFLQLLNRLIQFS